MRILGMLLIVGPCLMAVPAMAQDGREALLAKYRCPLADMLRQVYEAPSAYRERNRYLVLSSELPSEDYVQCMFAANRSKLYCEASSGYYAQAADKPRTRYPSSAAQEAFQAAQPRCQVVR